MFLKPLNLTLLLLLVWTAPAHALSPFIFNLPGHSSPTFHTISDSSRKESLGSALGMKLQWSFDPSITGGIGTHLLKAIVPDSLLPTKDSKLQSQNEDLATVFLFYVAFLSTPLADSIQVKVYSTGDSVKPKSEHTYNIQDLLKKKKNLKSRIKSFFNLCPYHDDLKITDSTVTASFSSPFDFNAENQMRFGTFSITFSIMITKYLDQKKRTIKTIYFKWRDLHNPPVDLHYSTLMSTYLQWEDMF